MAANIDFMAGNLYQPTPAEINFGSHILASNVQETVHIFMAIISIMILIFLAAHLFIRFHYKAKTEYALNEMREKFEKDAKGPSPYALKKEPEQEVKPVEIVMDPADLAPMVHNAALADIKKVEKPNKHVVYMDNA